jgi:sulfonate transport system substrate-binding protein
MNTFLKGLVGALALAGLAAGLSAPAMAQDKTVRIGIQKYGKLILLKAKGSLEKKLEPLGFTVTWTEFPAGPQLLEAVNVGAIDFGNTGEAPPIFAQAAGAPLLYVAHEPPAPRGEAILVPKDSPIKTVADLKGKKVALNKGSNVHYLLVKALEKAGVKYSEIEPNFLVPADARAAFEKGAVDAWAIWDPFQAAAEVATGARTLANGEGVVSNHQFYLASKAFAEANPKVVDALIAELSDVDKWVQSDPKGAAAQLSASTGIPAPVVELALARQSYGIEPISAEVVAAQQDIADTFLALGLLPKKITVSEVIWKAGS